MNLKHKTVKGVFWSTIEKFGVQGTQFITLIFLARLLSPSDFGLIGMLTVFIALSQAFIDSGFSAALIQKKETTNTDYSTIFFFNIAVSIFLYFILFFLAPYIAAFYHEPKLIFITRVISINFIINAFSIIQITLLKKELDFKTQSIINISGIIGAGITGITLALLGFGVWALIFQSLANAFLKTILFWIVNKWRPIFVFSKKSFKTLFSFGSKLLFAGLLNTIFQNLYLIVIGRYFNAAPLGYYTQAKKIQELPTMSINSIIQNVAFPSFSKIQDENEKLKKGLKLAIKMTTFILFPLMIFLMVAAKPIVITLLTEKWLPAVIYIQILSITGILFPIQLFNLTILNVKGRSDLFLRLEIIKKTLVVIAIVVGFHWGVLGLVISRVFTAVIALLINTFYTNKLIKYTILNQLTDILPYAIISLIMGLFIYGLTFIVEDNLYLLITEILTAFILYYGLARLFKLEAYCEIKTLIQPYIPKQLRLLL